MSNNKKKIMFMLNRAKEKQKEAESLLEEAMKIVSVVMDAETLEDVEKEELEKKAKDIIKDYVKENGDLLKEENQRELFLKLKEVNYKHQGLVYMLRDCNIKTKYIEPEDLLKWKSIKILDWGDSDG